MCRECSVAHQIEESDMCESYGMTEIGAADCSQLFHEKGRCPAGANEFEGNEGIFRYWKRK